MLAELVTYLTTPCPRHVRGMGYLYEAIALRERYRRCGRHWQAHLTHSRRAILEATAACRDHAAVVILGSGLLLDVPLAELADAFREVVLADIVHLPETRRQARRFGNVRLVACDVSGVAERLYRNRSALPDPAPADLSLGLDTSLVVSLNILSQLPVLPRRYALARRPGLEEGVTKDPGGPFFPKRVLQDLFRIHRGRGQGGRLVPADRGGAPGRP